MPSADESPLNREFEWFLKHHEELLRKYDGKFVVIKGEAVLGSYEDPLTAIHETVKSHEMGTFLVQMVSPGDSAYTRTYHSRVAFPVQ